MRKLRMEPRTYGFRRLIAVAAMLLLIIAGAYATSMHQRQQRLDALRAERQQIESELQRVKAIANESKPVVVLENGDTRLIVNHEQPHQSPGPYYY